MTQPAKHTPGPWIIDAVKFITTPKAVVIAELNDGLNGEYVDRGYWQQNAHLIAAAPAMYADAKQLCELVRDFMNDNRLYDGQVIQAISNLETALSQAEGRDK